jgi:uncharacterized membrane protein YgcG
MSRVSVGRERAIANLDLLATEEGARLLERLAEHSRRGGRFSSDVELRLAVRLRREFPAELVTAALGQHELRLRAAGKFRAAHAMWFTRDGLEQASAEPVARHRAARFAGRARVADLCCGIGGDLIALAGVLPSALAVDRDPVHLRMAAENAAVYGVAEQLDTVLGEVQEVPLPGVDAAFVDPARRAGGRRTPGSSEPPLQWCFELARRVPAIGVKAAPGLDRGVPPPGWELEFIAVGRELKEAVLWSPELAGARSRATVLPSRSGQTAGGGQTTGGGQTRGGGHATGGGQVSGGGGAAEPGAEPEPRAYQLSPEPGEPVACRAPGEYLLDPNPAVTRAGLVEELARKLGAWKIDPMIAFLSADEPVRSPFGRALRVLDSGPWREKDLAARLRGLDIGALDIRRRGLAGDVDVLRRKLRTTGSRPATLVMTRVNDRPWALICVDAEAGAR